MKNNTNLISLLLLIVVASTFLFFKNCYNPKKIINDNPNQPDTTFAPYKSYVPNTKPIILTTVQEVINYNTNFMNILNSTGKKVFASEYILTVADIMYTRRIAGCSGSCRITNAINNANVNLMVLSPVDANYKTLNIPSLISYTTTNLCPNVCDFTKGAPTPCGGFKNGQVMDKSLCDSYIQNYITAQSNKNLDIKRGFILDKSVINALFIDNLNVTIKCFWGADANKNRVIIFCGAHADGILNTKTNFYVMDESNVCPDNCD